MLHPFRRVAETGGEWRKCGGERREKDFDSSVPKCRFASVFLHFFRKTMISQFRLEDVVPGLNFDVELEPNKRVYCFIGKNGVGKTKMLEGLGQSLLLCHTLFSPKENPHRNFWAGAAVQLKLKDKDLGVPPGITLESTNIKNKKSETEAWGVTQLDRIARHQYYKQHKISQPLVYISAKNRGYLQTPNKDQLRLLGNVDERFVQNFEMLLTGLKSQAVESTSVAQWFIERLLINPAFVIGNAVRGSEVATVLELLENLEPSLKLVQRKENHLTLSIIYNEGKILLQGIAFEHLSTGYASILKIFQEIVAGYGAWTNADDLRNVEGIVFIDEIESHLHAEWQSKIIPILKKSFPKTTFFIATHSPLIVSTTEQDEAYQLVPEVREDGTFVVAKKLGNPRNWYLADVYEKGFDVDITGIMKNGTDGTKEPTVLDMMQDFSFKVKEYQAEQRPELREEIFALYNNIVPSVPDTDPRRRSLDLLKGLVA